MMKYKNIELHFTLFEGKTVTSWVSHTLSAAVQDSRCCRWDQGSTLHNISWQCTWYKFSDRNCSVTFITSKNNNTKNRTEHFAAMVYWLMFYFAIYLWVSQYWKYNLYHEIILIGISISRENKTRSWCCTVFIMTLPLFRKKKFTRRFHNRIRKYILRMNSQLNFGMETHKWSHENSRKDFIKEFANTFPTKINLKNPQAFAKKIVKKIKIFFYKEFAMRFQ